jgi:putative membrane protein
MSTGHQRSARRPLLAGATTLSALAIAVVGSVPMAAAANDDGVDVVNTETVQVYVGSDGEIDSQRVYEQLTLTGKGSVDVANPVGEAGLRNLDGFSGFDTENGFQHVRADVDGVERYRSVSDFTGELPLDVTVEYVLDGEPVEPDDLVGAEGALEVEYTVRNVTAEPRDVTFDDGKGGTVTKSVAVPIPMVGSLTTTAPARFTQVRSQQANTAGDGKGGTKLSFTMTLFPPLGSDTATFGYTATITDGVVPSSTISALPVNPLESPTFKTAGSSYKAGADTGARLAAGATEIDTNLLKLRDGAAELLNGLLRLSDGADRLNAGLAGEAAPGAERLAAGAGELRNGLGLLEDGAGRLRDGAGRLDDGAGRLADGARRISDGAGQLSDGTGAALSGSRALEDGLQQISGGLDRLSGVEGLPKALKGVDALKDGVDTIIAKVGTTDQANTLLWGLDQLATRLPAARDGSAQLLGGLQQLRGDGSPETPGLVAAKGGVDQVQAGLAEAVKDGGSLDQLIGGLRLVTGTDCGLICKGIINEQILPKVEASKESLGLANGGLIQVSGGLGQAIQGLDGQLIPGMTELNTGLTQAAEGASTLREGGVQLRGGLLQVQTGLGALQAGLTDAVAGVLRLSAGAQEAHAGSGDLADGLGLIDDGAARLASGAGELDDGASRLRAGTGELADGSVRLADGMGEASQGSVRIEDGAARLADGLDEAADGSGRLAAGLQTAADGAPKLVDGAGRLSDEGMSKLIRAGEDTAQSYGELYATIGAAAERADTERMAYGAPEGAAGLTAYSYELMGSDGEGGRNLTRGLGAALLLGLGLGVMALRRRFI